MVKKKKKMAKKGYFEFHVQVTEELHREYMKYCQDHGFTMAARIRMLVKEELRKHRKKK